MEQYRKHTHAPSSNALDADIPKSKEILVKISIPEKSINSVLRFEPNFTVTEAITKIVKRYPVDDVKLYGLFKDNLLVDERITLAELELTNYSVIELRKLNTANPNQATPVKTTRAKTRVGRALFSIPLTQAMNHQREKHPDLKIPLFVKRAIRHLLREGLGVKGLFRVGGSSDVVIAIRDALDRGEDVDFEKERTSIPDVCELLKIYFRNLPDSLFTSELYDSFLAVYKMMRIKDSAVEVRKHQLSRLSTLFSFLPEVNRRVTAEIMHFFNILILNSNVNGLTPEEIGAIFGPIFIWKKGAGDLEFSEERKGIMRLIIEEYTSLFEGMEEQFNFGAVRRTEITPRSSRVEKAIGAGQQQKGRLSLTLEELEDELNYNHKLEQEYKKVQWALFRKKLVGHKKSVMCMTEVVMVVQHDHPHQIWSADSSGTIRVWDAETFAFIKEIESGTTARIFSMGNSKNRYVWVGSIAFIRIYDAQTLSLVKELTPGAFAFASGLGDQVWAGSDGKVFAWNVKTWSADVSISIPNNFVLSLIHDKNRSRIWGGAEKCIYVWDSKNGNQIKHITERVRGKIYTISYVEDKIWSGSDDETISIYNAQTCELLKKIDANLGAIYGLCSFGNYTWSCGWDMNIYIWESASATCFSKLSGYHSDSVSAVIKVWNAKKKAWYAWSSSWDKSICIWQIHPRNINSADAMKGGSSYVSSPSTANKPQAVPTKKTGPLVPIAITPKNPVGSPVKAAAVALSPKPPVKKSVVEEKKEGNVSSMIKDIDKSLESLWAEFEGLKAEATNGTAKLTNSGNADPEVVEVTKKLLANQYDNVEEVMVTWKDFIDAAENDNDALIEIINTPSTFSTILKAFSPIKSYIEKVQAVIGSSYFYGFISTFEAKRFIETEQKGTFLLRCSLSKPFCFVIEYVSEYRTSITAYLIRSHPTGFVFELEDKQESFPSIQHFIDAKIQLRLLSRPFISKIPKMPWFHGDLTGEEAHEALEGQPAGTFLVRFSSQPGCFAVCYVGSDMQITKVIVTQTGNGFQFSSDGPHWPHLENLIKSHEHILKKPYVPKN